MAVPFTRRSIRAKLQDVNFNSTQRAVLAELLDELFTDYDDGLDSGGSATSGEYTPTITPELNSGGTITVIDPWVWVRVGDYVFVQVNASIDSNASAGDYQVEVKFTLPVATSDISTIAGSVAGVDVDAATSVFAGIIEGRNGSDSGTPGAILNTYYPVDAGIARLKGTFAYKVVA